MDKEVNTDEVRIPPLVVQPFVENVIWHGLLPNSGNKKLVIRVSRSQETVIIEIDDNGVGLQKENIYKDNVIKQRSFGLEITSDRLELIKKSYGIAISFEVVNKTNSNNEPEGTKAILRIAKA